MDKKELRLLKKAAQTLELTDGEREKAAGSFIKLPCGVTHYEMAGSGPPAVLVHGYVTPYHIYDKVFDALVEAGYKVLRYDLLGRGLSERADAVYSPQLFAKQLDELTRALLGEESFLLFGVSMGCCVATSFCRFYPGRASRVILFSPAGMDTFKPPFYMKLCRIPVFGDILFDIVGTSALIKRASSGLLHTDEPEKDEYIRKFAYCTKYKGISRCLLSSLRHTILNTAEDMKGYVSVSEQGIPLLAVWGTLDETMPYHQHERFVETCPNAKFVTFEGSGHDFLYDEGERTMKEVFEFLAQENSKIN